MTIASPADNAVISAPVDVVGTASDTNLVYYVLEAAPVGSDQFTEMFRGTTSVIDDVLGKFDTSGLSNGSYRLRLSAILLGSCPAFLKDFKNALCSSASKSLTEVGLSVTRCWRSATRHPNTAPTTYAGKSHHEKLVPSRLAPRNVERIACSQGGCQSWRNSSTQVTSSTPTAMRVASSRRGTIGNVMAHAFTVTIVIVSLLADWATPASSRCVTATWDA